MALRRSVGALRLSQRSWTDGALLREVGNAAEQSRGEHLLADLCVVLHRCRANLAWVRCGRHALTLRRIF